jgi:hypothetical protein
MLVPPLNIYIGTPLNIKLSLTGFPKKCTTIKLIEAKKLDL